MDEMDGWSLPVAGATMRPVAVDDADELFACVDGARASLRRWLPWVDANVAVDDTRVFLLGCAARREAGTSREWTLRLDGRAVGVIGLRAIDRANLAAEIGYWIAPSAEGRGIVTEACRRAVDHAFGALGLHRVRIACATGNARSRAIPERLGFTHEGTLRDAERLPDGCVDHALYALLATEWPPR